jgi:putative ATP-binding cassette transporter
MLFKLIHEEVTAAQMEKKIIGSALLSGMANAGILATINAASHSSDISSPRLFFFFLLSCMVYALFLRYCVGEISRLFEAALYRVRLRVLNKVREGELQSLERIGTTEIYERLTQEANTVRASPRLSV